MARRPFGRMATDDVRLAIIGRDRTLPDPRAAWPASGTGWTAGDGAGRSWTRPPASASGTHVTLGELTVEDLATRFVAGHVEDHLDQLLTTLDGQPARR